ncbi:uncharacterized protein L969DRAFT_46352 [Mixia osmundae IAM 14324]|uniref:Uncharacterized protein n=1 Tax=Mixia osmundae (strain CBS 9802 / IAM 14324 / JCM 22182 / KY 12970) TaxID=764103 RepID=G7E615_MIXOS|nr:uncharacterized protein L969DRAFT_46352 [Mixia osmundae IAM 14324]KEI40576.1 hypothetical protein L969DRAFT_46352 [Mixia osmundae IAM 14324]GAA98275.1 hypothetical protein E5Q_04958 [Mixia osmundae IAM 14324]
MSVIPASNSERKAATHGSLQKKHIKRTSELRRPTSAADSNESDSEDEEARERAQALLDARLSSRYPRQISAKVIGKRKVQEESSEEQSSEDDNAELDRLFAAPQVTTARASGGTAAREPKVTVFHDPSRVSTLPATVTASRKELRAFMSPSTAKLLGHEPEETYIIAKQRKRAAQKAREGPQDAETDAAQEKEMASLDSTLQRIISTLPLDGSARPGASRDEISMIMPRKVDAPIQKNTPLPLVRALLSSRLNRAKNEAENARKAGIVTGRSSNKSNRAAMQGHAGDIAITKRELGLQAGTEEKRRKEARGIGSRFGKLSGSMIKLSAAELRLGAEGRTFAEGSHKAGGKPKKARAGKQRSGSKAKKRH